MKGFTIIELLIVFAVIGVITTISVGSYSTYNQSQVFNGSVADVFSLLSTAKSKAISQVKPASCSGSLLNGYKVGISPSGSDYQQDVVCGGISRAIKRGKLPDNVSFDGSSKPSITFDVSTGSVTDPGSIIISGYGKSSSIVVSKTGNITLGASVATGPTPTSLFTYLTPTPISGCAKDYYLIYGYCFFVGNGYGQWCNSTCTDASSTPVPTPAANCARNYYYSAPYCVFVGGGFGQHCDPTCSGATLPTPTPTSAASVPTPTPTVPPIIPTPTPFPTQVPTIPTTANVSISFSINPNPASTSQNISFTATVTGTDCTPTGAVYFYWNNQTVRYTAGSTGSSNPGIASASYPASVIGTGSHIAYATYVPSSSTCPGRTSSTVNFTIQ